MYQCPQCRSKDVHWSRSKSMWETWRKKITGNPVYRCRNCRWRGWVVDVSPDAGEEQVEPSRYTRAPETPNDVPELDLELLDSEPDRQSGVSAPKP